MGLVVMGEGDHARPLLIHRISKGNAYQRQGGEPRLHLGFMVTSAEASSGTLPKWELPAAYDPSMPALLPADDTIISWTDPEIGTDIALSFQVSSLAAGAFLFCCPLHLTGPAAAVILKTPASLPVQEARGCNYIWEQVLHVQESSSPPHDDDNPGGGIDSALFGPRRLGGGGGLDDFDAAGPAGRYDGRGAGYGCEVFGSVEGSFAAELVQHITCNRCALLRLPVSPQRWVL